MPAGPPPAMQQGITRSAVSAMASSVRSARPARAGSGAGFSGCAIKPDRRPRPPRARPAQENAAMSATSHDCDFLIVGAGIAGASIGHFLAPHGRTVVLERERQPGYHSTGRSAALFLESYGTAQVRALTRASRSFLEAPPAGFADGPILSPRGALFVAEPGHDAELAALWDVMQSVSPRGRLLDADGACEL